MLFTGDIDENVENLLPSSKLQTAQILKVAHHGSRFSTSENFLQGKFFRAAVISVGYNHYGHPTEEVLHRLEDADIEYFRTDENGCVLLTIDDCGWTMDYYFDCYHNCICYYCTCLKITIRISSSYLIYF